ncbi:MAG: porin [Telluria sp.]|nr:porin [Telluria sp.]
MTQLSLTNVPGVLACLLCAAGAHAQSPVIAFGTLDVTLEQVGPAAPHRRISSNSSGFGFRASEDLGAGLRAFFQVEGSLSVDTGVASLGTRDTFVGLSGPFGTVRAGTMTTPLRALGGRLNFVPGGTSIANNMGVMSTLNGMHAGLNSRLSNSIQYALPPFRGLAVTLVYAPGELRPGGDDDSSYGMGINYQAGPWHLGVAHENRGAQRKQALGSSNDWESRAALRYTAGELSWNLGWDRLASDGLYQGARGGVARDAWSGAVMWRRARHDLSLNYSLALGLDCSGNARSGQCAPAAVATTGARQLALLYHYTFSKRTMLLAFYSTIFNEANGRYDYDVNPLVPALAARAPGSHLRALALGIRHSY